MLNLHYPWINIGKSKNVKCCICNNKNPQKIIKKFILNNKQISIKKCEKDQLMYFFPQPDEEYCKKLYNHPTYYKGSEDMYGLSINNKKSKEIALIRFEEITQYMKNFSSLLEIGCAKGNLLEEAKKRGVSTTQGIEFSRQAVNECKRKGLNVIEADINKIEKIFFSSPFEIIVVYSVLEHLNNPSLFLKKIKKFLVKEGLIFIRIPNTNSVYGPKLSLLDHFWHFNRKSIKRILEKNGFTIKKIFKSGVFKGTKYPGVLENITIVATLKNQEKQ